MTAGDPVANPAAPAAIPVTPVKRLGFPLVETTRHLGEQALRILGADAVRMPGEFVGNLLDRHSGAGQVPNHFGKPLAALAFVGAVLKELAIVIRLLRAGGVEIEQRGRLCWLPGKARQQLVQIAVDLAHRLALTLLQARDRDEAGAVAVQLEPLAAGL